MNKEMSPTKSQVASFKKELAAFVLGSVITAFSTAAIATPVTAVVRLQERVPMESLAEVVKSGSTPFVRGYTSDEIRQISAPADADYAALIDQLRAEGLQIVSESPTHLWISVRGDHQEFARIFGTQFQFRGTQRRAMATEIPSHLSLIASVHGLSNSLQLHPMHSQLPQAGLASAPSGMTRDLITSHYKFDALYSQGVSGAGQHIAVATYGDIDTSVVEHFYQALNLNPMPTVNKVTFNGTPAMNDDSAMETSLDAEFSGMIAPGVAVHIYTSANNDDSGETQMFTKILDDGDAKIVNYSWGSCEKQLTAEHATEMDKIFARAIAQGVNIMVASGDSGSDACRDKTTVADWPGAHPDVVTVGGTSLAGAQGSAEYTESAWSGSGGGISAQWERPTYQSKLTKKYAKRSYPDVAFNADGQVSGQPIYVSYQGKKGWAVVGGTSMAAPQWAGFLALVNNARATAGKDSLGFLNPIIYAISTHDRESVFHDVTSGSNGAYKAGKGWDAVTGFGSPEADALLNYLVQQ